MSDGAPGPGWWQASDLKWYPPQRQPAAAAPTPQPPPSVRPADPSPYIAPAAPPPYTGPADSPPPPYPGPADPPATPQGRSARSKIGSVLGGLALIGLVFLTIAFVLLEPWYHGHHFSLSVFVVVVAILIIGLAIGVRSGQSLVRTAIFVIAMVVIYLTVPRLGVDGTHRLYQNLREKISTLSSPSTSDQLGRKGGGAGRAEVEAFGPMGAAAMPSGHACQASTSTTPRLPV